jgi:hypothetical protein
MEVCSAGATDYDPPLSARLLSRCVGFAAFFTSLSCESSGSPDAAGLEGSLHRIALHESPDQKRHQRPARRDGLPGRRQRQRLLEERLVNRPLSCCRRGRRCCSWATKCVARSTATTTRTCQDGEISWFDWSLLERHGDIRRFVAALNAWRQQRDVVTDKCRLSLNETLRGRRRPTFAAGTTRRVTSRDYRVALVQS